MRVLYHITVATIMLVGLSLGVLITVSKPKLIETDIRDFGNLCRQYIYRQEQREFPKRNFDAHMQEKEKPLW